MTLKSDRLLGSVKGAPQLAAIIAMLISRSHVNGKVVAQVSEALVSHLYGTRRDIGLGVRLAARTLSPEKFVSAVFIASDGGLLHPGAVFEAVQAATEVVRDDPKAIEPAEKCLRTAANAGARRIGLAILAADAAKRGWDENARAYLEAYRLDTDPWVAEAAGLIQPPAETRRDGIGGPKTG